MRLVAAAFVFLACLFWGPRDAAASVEARINISTQKMEVLVDGAKQYEWEVSTGRKGYVTPKGEYRPQAMYQKYYSHKYHNSPMPNAIFFAGGYAVHGTYETHHLGKPASHGCVRLDPKNAALLFSLVTQHGKGNTRIVIQR